MAEAFFKVLIDNLTSLIKNIRYMTNLRHILLQGCWSLSHTPYRIGELVSLKTLCLFLVGESTGNQLDEFECLNLGGRLEIQHLERVKNHLMAKKANLFKKPNLCHLVLHWKGDTASSELTKMVELDEKVLEALEPHPNLAILELDGFQGRDLAFWTKSMKNMCRVSIDSCKNFRHVSPLGDLPFLKCLLLLNLEALEYIVEENEVGRKMAKFPSLEELYLTNLPNLKGWLKEGEVVEMFPNLHSLRIERCDSLRLTSTSGGLNSLSIYYCFREGSLQHLTDLQELRIGYCREHELDDVADEMKHLHLLKSLQLVHISDMASVPEALQHIPSLQSLKLSYLRQLTSLPDWLPNLVSLTRLEIQHCPMLTSLPSSIQGMTNLKLLTILGCPQLKSRCEEPNGEDWHNISHIPHLDI